jgi:hypothetical protein
MRWIGGIIFVASIGGTGCVAFERNNGNELSPSSISDGGGGSPTGGAPSLMGVWASEPLDGLSNPGSCADVQWRVTSQTPTSLAGEFAATCGGGVSILGTASGRLIGNEVPMEASGTATLPGLPPCDFSLTGTGYIEGGDAIRIQYSGTSCLGPVQGEETLRRPPPPEDPAPPPPPPPPPSPAPANPNHVPPGPLTTVRAQQTVFATSAEFAHLRAPRPTQAQAQSAAEELLRRTIWHLRLAGFPAGRQRNPSGAISNDKLTIAIDGGWRAYDIFMDYGRPGVTMRVIFLEVFPANSVADSGIPD